MLVNHVDVNARGIALRAFSVFGGASAAAGRGDRIIREVKRARVAGLSHIRTGTSRSMRHMAEALYRKYRPQIFEDVVGQEQIERTIKNAIEQDKVSHAYLFCGPRGTGKTTTARLLAKALLCEKGPTANPDGTCEDCTMIAEGTHPDVYELDAASRTGVENVREEIISRVQFAPTRGRYKVYIIDEVHMLSIAAFNALLKTLEEPPEHVVFILATTDPQKVPETIHSRCQRFDFRRISNESIVSRLGAVCVAEGVEFEGDALDLIAHHAGGGMRNALTSLEQMIAFGEGKVTLEVAERLLGGADSDDVSDIMKALGARDGAACFKWIAEYSETGSDLAQFARELAEHVRNLYVMSLSDATVTLEVSTPERRQLESELPLFGPERLARMLMVLGDVLAELKTSTNPRLSFEIACTRMVHPEGDLTLAALAERIEALEEGAAARPALAMQAEAPQAAPVSRAAVQPEEAAQVESAGARESARPPAQPGCAGGTASQPAPAPQAAPAARPEPAPQMAPQPATAPQAAPSPMPAPAPQAAPQPATAPKPAADPQPASASQPAVSAASNPQLAATFANPAALQRIWQAALASLKRVKAAYGVLFLGTKAIYDGAANVLRIEFPKENAFAFKAVQKSDVQDHVSAALAQALGGQSVPFAFTQADSSAAPAGPASAHVAAPASMPVASSVADPAPHQAMQPSANPQISPVDHLSTSQARRPSSPPASPAARQPAATAPRSAAPAGANGASRNVAPSQAAARMTPPWEDEQVPYDDSTAISFDEQIDAPMPSAQPVQPARPTPSAQSARPASSARPAQPAQSSSAQQGAQTPEDLQSILQAGFGGGVTFEEVE